MKLNNVNVNKALFFPSLLGTAPGTVSPVLANESAFVVNLTTMSHLLYIFHSFIDNAGFLFFRYKSSNYVDPK